MLLGVFFWCGNEDLFWSFMKVVLYIFAEEFIGEKEGSGGF